MSYRLAVVLGMLGLAVCPAGAQKPASKGPWHGTITATIVASEPGYESEGIMNCDLKGTSARCTYDATSKATGKNAFVITESATQEHLQVSVVPGKGEWKLRVAAFISRGTKTITANGKSLSGNDVAVQATNWEVPIPEPRDPNRLVGTWKNPLGDTIKWELSR